jgi:hypothetical protein
MRYDDAMKDRESRKNEDEVASLTARVTSHADAGQDMRRSDFPVLGALSTV